MTRVIGALRQTKEAAPTNRSQVGSAVTAPPAAPTLPMLLDELVELGREAWWISERERAVRAKIDALKEMEEHQC